MKAEITSVLLVLTILFTPMFGFEAVSASETSGSCGAAEEIYN